MIRGEHSFTEHEEPRLVITVDGWDDVYRFAHHLEHGQCEFADVGRKAVAYLKRKAGAPLWKQFMRRMHGDGGYR